MPAVRAALNAVEKICKHKFFVAVLLLNSSAR